MRGRQALLVALGVALALAATTSAWASVPRVITAENFGYPG
jgi:hypothetical protein